MIRAFRILCVIGLLIMATNIAQAGTCEQRAKPIADLLEIEGENVIRIWDIRPGTPAGKLSQDGLLNIGDLILGFNEVKLGNFSYADRFMDDLRLEAATSIAWMTVRPFDKVSGTYDSKTRQVQLVLNPAAGEKLIGIATDWSYLVMNVPETTHAFKRGLRSGDFIREIEGKQVSMLKGPIFLEIEAGKASRKATPVLSLTVATWNFHEAGGMRILPRSIRVTIPRHIGKKGGCN